MYLPIFVEKVFNSSDPILYVTEPVYVGGFKDFIYDLQIRELSVSTILEVIVEQSATGNYAQSEEWSVLGSPNSLDRIGHAVFSTGQFLNYIRFRIQLRNPRGRSIAKLTLTGHLTRR